LHPQNQGKTNPGVLQARRIISPTSSARVDERQEAATLQLKCSRSMAEFRRAAILPPSLGLLRSFAHVTNQMARIEGDF
jgi:hypothetical protein